MIFKVKDIESFVRFAKELKEINANGLILKEELRNPSGNLTNIKLCLQTEVTDVFFECPEEDPEKEGTRKNSIGLVKELENLYRVCHVQTITINTTEETSSVLF